MVGHLVKTLGSATAAALLSTVVVAAPAHADSRVSVTNDQGRAVADPTYATTLNLKGSGFQSVKGGYGGIYVLFGTVSGTWKPSKGGTAGSSYLYVPDSQDKDNQGFEKFVAFSGSDTASSANGGTLSAAGAWRTAIVVPGATFQTVDSNGKARTVDCRKVTCGIITIGAHGLTNARNETFTPVRFADLGTAVSSSPSATAAASPTATSSVVAVPSAPGTPSAPGAVAGVPTASATPTLSVDRATAVAGRVLSFVAQGFRPGEEVGATFDDGMAAVGPIAAGTSGEVAGVLQLPTDTAVGTHVLRVTGAASGATATANFAVAAGTVAGAVEPVASESRTPYLFLVLSVVLLAGAVGFTLVRRLRGRRRTGGADAI